MGQIVNIPIIGQPEPLFAEGEKPYFDNVKARRIGRAIDYHDTLLAYAVTFEPALKELIHHATITRFQEVFPRRSTVSLESLFDEDVKSIDFTHGGVDYVVPITKGSPAYARWTEAVATMVDNLEIMGLANEGSGGPILVERDPVRGYEIVLISPQYLRDFAKGLKSDELIDLQEALGLSVMKFNDSLFERVVDIGYESIDDVDRIRRLVPVNSIKYHNLLHQAALVKGTIITPAEECNKSLVAEAPKSKRASSTRTAVTPTQKYDITSKLTDRKSPKPKETFEGVCTLLDQMVFRVGRVGLYREPKRRSIKIGENRMTLTYQRIHNGRGKRVGYISTFDLRRLIQDVRDEGLERVGSTTAQRLQLTSKPPKLGNIVDILKHV